MRRSGRIQDVRTLPPQQELARSRSGRKPRRSAGCRRACTNCNALTARAVGRKSTVGEPWRPAAQITPLPGGRSAATVSSFHWWEVREGEEVYQATAISDPVGVQAAVRFLSRV